MGFEMTSKLGAGDGDEGDGGGLKGGGTRKLDPGVFAFLFNAGSPCKSDINGSDLVAGGVCENGGFNTVGSTCNLCTFFTQNMATSIHFLEIFRRYVN